MPPYIYTQMKLDLLQYVYYTNRLVALAVRCDLEMQITAIINNYDHDQLGFITQDMLAPAVCY